MNRQMQPVDVYELRPGDEFVEDYDISEIFIAKDFIMGPNGPCDNPYLVGVSQNGDEVTFFYSGSHVHYGPNLQKLVYVETK